MEAVFSDQMLAPPQLESALVFLDLSWLATNSRSQKLSVLESQLSSKTMQPTLIREPFENTVALIKKPNDSNYSSLQLTKQDENPVARLKVR